MDLHRPDQANVLGPNPHAKRWLMDAGLVCLLLLIAGLIHGWLLRHTIVMSRDGIGFINYAWRLEHQPWRQVLRQNAQHPLYPLGILAASQVVRHAVTASPADVMMLSAQYVGALAGILLVVPMYYLGRSLFNRGVGFWAAVLFQCFPIGARATADALSEGPYLLLSVCALLAAVYAARKPAALWFATCGIFSGLAYMTRPEGAAIAAAAGLIIFARQFSRTYRLVWKSTLGHAVALSAGALLTSGPYMVTIGHLTGKHTALESVGLAMVSPRANSCTVAQPLSRSELPQPVHSPTYCKRPVAWASFGIFLNWGPHHRPNGFRGVLAGMWVLATEIDRGFHHVAWVFALAGLFWFSRRLDPARWTVLTLCLLQCLALCGLVFIVGYLADRHVLLLVICGLFWAVAAIQELPRRLRLVSATASTAASPTGWQSRFMSAPALSGILLLALAGSGLPKTLEPLHPQRAGHRVAGQWLAAHARSGDMIEDPYYWAEYYAGWDFGLAPARQQNDGSWNHYIVVERSKNSHPRLSVIPEEIVKRGTPVFQCPLRSDKHNLEEVQVLTINFTRQAVKPPALRNVP